MKLFWPRLDVNHFQYFLQEREEDGMAFFLGGTAVAASWVPPPVFIFKPKHKRGDFFQFGGTGWIVSPRASGVLRPDLEHAGELLPLPYDGEEYTFLHVLHSIDCVDLARAPKNLNPERGERYTLKPGGIDLLRQTPSVIFKFPLSAVILVVEGLRAPDQELRAVVEREGLKGLVFWEVWSDEDDAR